MTDLEKLKRQIELLRVKPEKVNPDYAFHTAWNSCLESVSEQIRKIEKGEL